MENKVLLAIGFRQLEDFVQRAVKNEFLFVANVPYREGVIRQIGNTNPNIVIIRESLEGKENILSLVYEIRSRFPKVRVVFLARKRAPGDPFLATLVQYGIYDVLYGEKLNAKDVIRLLREPNEYKDVLHLLPKPNFDEKKNKILGFEAPDTITVEREVIREVYVDNGKSNASVEVETPTPELIMDKPPIKESEKQTVIQPDIQEEPEAEKSVVLPVVKKPEQAVAVAEPQAAEPDKPIPDVKPEPSDPEPTLVTKPEVQSKKDEIKPEKTGISKLFGKRDDAAISGTGKQKIITFMGAKHGIGNTSLALNTAVMLAQRNQKVILLEMNDRTPSVNYWFEMGHLDKGIETALSGLKEKKFDKVEQAITRSEDLKDSPSGMKRNYKKFPSTLDFMFYSQHYLTRTDRDELSADLSFTKELYLYLLFQMEYDFIIIDVPAQLELESTANALVYSNKVFVTLSQDVSSIGNALYLLNELQKHGIQVEKKVHFIVNRYEKASLDVSGICEWMNVEEVLLVPSLNKEFINANYDGLPILLHARNSQLRTAIQKIESKIL